MNSETIKAMYMSSEGRIGRLTYFGYGVALAVVFGIVGAVLTALLGSIGLIITDILYIVMLYFHYNLVAKRFHDLNHPTQYALYLIGAALVAGVLLQISALHLIGILLELVLLVVALYLLFMPGTAGANSYGAAP